MRFFWVVSLALSDQTFLAQWRHALRWEDLPKGPVQFILAAALEHWDDHHQLLDWPSFLGYLDVVVEDDDVREEYRQTYTDLTTAYAITESSLPLAWEQAEQWLQEYHISLALDRARSALAAGDRSSAFQELLGLHEIAEREAPAPPVSLEDTQLGVLLSQRPDRSAACPTGIPRLDEMWEGGVYPGHFAIVAAPTNVGKSMALSAFAAAGYVANKRLLFFTYELTKVEVAERILMALFRIPKQRLNPDIVVDKLLELRRQSGLTTASLVIDDGEGIRTVADLRGRLEGEDIDLVLLDSADDLHPSRNYTKTYEALGDIYSGIRLDICQRLGLPVWTSVQLNREAVERAHVSEKYIGDSFKKVQRANLALGISQTVEEREHFLGPFVKLVVLKDSEHGSKGKWARYRTLFGRGNEGYPGFEFWPERGDLD